MSYILKRLHVLMILSLSSEHVYGLQTMPCNGTAHITVKPV